MNFVIKPCNYMKNINKKGSVELYSGLLLIILTIVPTTLMAIMGLIPYMGLLFVSIGIVLVASIYIRVVANKYLDEEVSSCLTGSQIAECILMKEGISDVRLARANSMLGEYYDPNNKVVAISDKLANSSSITSTAVVAHEIGHVIQHHTDSYLPIKLRGFLIRIAQIAESLSLIVFVFSIFFGGTAYLDYVIAILTLSIVIQIITLPVEINASVRAYKMLKKYNLISDDDSKKVKSVLQAAAMTYIAGLLSSILQLIRLLLIRADRD